VLRRGFGTVLLGLGVCALVLAVLLPTYVVSHSKKTPLDLNITLHSTGAATALNSATGATEQVQLRATRFVVTDSHASNGTVTTVNEHVCIVIVSGTTPDCLTAQDPRLLSVTTDRVTADRRSAEAVNIAAYGENVNGDTSVRHSGLSYKFPIDTKKQTYQFYNPDVKKAVPATYSGTSKINGLTVYEFVSETPEQSYSIQGTFPGTYVDTRTVYVEPNTGAIIKGVEHQKQTLASGQVALETTLTFDSAAIKYQSDFAKSKISQLKQAQLYGPIGAGVLALVLLLGAFLLIRSRDADSTNRHGGGDQPAPEYATTHD
jgi:hypothetical protein